MTPHPARGRAVGEASGPGLAAHQDRTDLWACTQRCPSSFPSLCMLLVPCHRACRSGTPLAMRTHPYQPH